MQANDNFFIMLHYSRGCRAPDKFSSFRFFPVLSLNFFTPDFLLWEVLTHYKQFSDLHVYIFHGLASINVLVSISEQCNS